MTFDEWKYTGRPCFYYKIGALSEAHRQHGLHHASAGFSVEDCDGIIKALIEACTPLGLQHLRESNNTIDPTPSTNDFGNQHWLLFRDLMNSSMEASSIRWARCSYQPWAIEHENQVLITPRQRLKSLISRAPGGLKLISLWRRIRSR